MASLLDLLATYERRRKLYLDALNLETNALDNVRRFHAGNVSGCRRCLDLLATVVKARTAMLTNMIDAEIAFYEAAGSVEFVVKVADDPRLPPVEAWTQTARGTRRPEALREVDSL